MGYSNIRNENFQRMLPDPMVFFAVYMSVPCTYILWYFVAGCCLCAQCPVYTVWTSACCKLFHKMYVFHTFLLHGVAYKYILYKGRLHVQFVHTIVAWSHLKVQFVHTIFVGCRLYVKLARSCCSMLFVGFLHFVHSCCKVPPKNTVCSYSCYRVVACRKHILYTLVAGCRLNSYTYCLYICTYFCCREPPGSISFWGRRARRVAWRTGSPPARE